MTLEIRPIVEADRTRVAEVSSQIWGDEDWVPEAFDEWLSDRDGEAVAAVLDGRLIGFARRTWILPRHAWFEGIRSDPAHRGAGAGRALTEHLIEAARNDGAEAIHLSTHAGNEASIHIIESYGFRRVASFAYVEKEIGEEASGAAIDSGIVSVPEDEAAGFIDRSAFLELAHRQFPRGWRFIPFDLDPRGATARLGTRIGIRLDGEIVALLCLRQPVGGGGPTVLNFADGAPDDIRRLVREAHRRYAGRRIEVMVPVDGDRVAAVLSVLQESGYASEDDYAAAVFVYRLDLY